MSGWLERDEASRANEVIKAAASLVERLKSQNFVSPGDAASFIRREAGILQHQKGWSDLMRQGFIEFMGLLILEFKRPED